MNTTNVGKQAETAAAEHLTRHGFSIVERNFSTPRCEIDVIAQKGDCIYFVEVKYRSSVNQGAGLDYVTAHKQKQMYYAAETWMQEHEWAGESVLSAIEVDHNFHVAEFIESIA